MSSVGARRRVHAVRRRAAVHRADAAPARRRSSRSSLSTSRRLSPRAPGSSASFRAAALWRQGRRVRRHLPHGRGGHHVDRRLQSHPHGAKWSPPWIRLSRGAGRGAHPPPRPGEGGAHDTLRFAFRETVEASILELHAALKAGTLTTRELQNCGGARSVTRNLGVAPLPAPVRAAFAAHGVDSPHTRRTGSCDARTPIPASWRRRGGTTRRDGPARGCA